MNPHFTLFNNAMARPGEAHRSTRASAVSVAAVLVGAAVLAVIAISLIAS